MLLLVVDGGVGVLYVAHNVFLFNLNNSYLPCYNL